MLKHSKFLPRYTMSSPAATWAHHWDLLSVARGHQRKHGTQNAHETRATARVQGVIGMSVLKRRVRLDGLSGCVMCVCTCVCMCAHVEAEVNFGYLPKLFFTLFFFPGSHCFSQSGEPVSPRTDLSQPLSCGLGTVRHFACLLFLFLVCFRYGLWGKLGYSYLCSEYLTDSAISPGPWCVNCKCQSSM